MAFYKCPVCGQKGHLHLGKADFFEWAASIFGQFHAYEEKSLLPLLCHKHQAEAGGPNTIQEVEAFVARKKGNNGQAQAQGLEPTFEATYIRRAKVSPPVKKKEEAAAAAVPPKPSPRIVSPFDAWAARQAAKRRK